MKYLTSLLRQQYLFVYISSLAILSIATIGVIGLLVSPYTGITFSSSPNGKWHISAIDKTGPAADYNYLIGAEVLSIQGRELKKYDLAKEFDDITTKKEFCRFIDTQKYFNTNITKNAPLNITILKNNKKQTMRIIPADYPPILILEKTWILMLVAIFSLFIGIIVISKKIDDIRACIFFLMVSGEFLVQTTLAIFMARDLSFNFTTFIILDIFNNLALFYGSAALLHFSIIFPQPKSFGQNRIVIAVLYIGAILGAILYGTHIFYYYYHVFIPLCMLMGITAIIHSYFVMVSPALKTQAKIVMLGTAISLGIFPIFYFGPMILTGERFMSGSLPMLTTTLIPLAMAFAIMRYKLMDIDTLFDNTLIYMLTLGILAIIDVGLISTLINTKILNFSISTPVATTIAVWLVILVYIPVRDRIQKWIKYLLNREVYDIHKISLELNKGLLCAGSIEAAFEKTMDILKKTLRPKGGYALLLNEKGSVIMWNDAYPVDLPIDIESIKHSNHPVSLFNASDTIPLPQNYSGGVLVPIVGSGEHLAYLILQNKDSGRLYDKEDLTLLNVISTQIAMSLEAILSREKMIQKEKEVIAEKERISREIHDGIGNNLAQALILTNIAEKNKKRLCDIQNILTESMANLRELIWTVEPGSGTLRDLGAYISDKTQYLRYDENINLHIDISIEHEQIEVSSAIKLNLLRIIQESITNIIKHAEATSIHIELEQHEDKLKLKIEDNGKGFDIEKLHEGGYGLRNIKKRCREMNANLNIISSPGKGTHIAIELSL